MYVYILHLLLILYISIIRKDNEVRTKMDIEKTKKKIKYLESLGYKIIITS